MSNSEYYGGGGGGGGQPYGGGAGSGGYGQQQQYPGQGQGPSPPYPPQNQYAAPPPPAGQYGASPPPQYGAPHGYPGGGGAHQQQQQPPGGAVAGSKLEDHFGGGKDKKKKKKDKKDKKDKKTRRTRSPRRVTRRRAAAAAALRARRAILIEPGQTRLEFDFFVSFAPCVEMVVFVRERAKMRSGATIYGVSHLAGSFCGEQQQQASEVGGSVAGCIRSIRARVRQRSKYRSDDLSLIYLTNSPNTRSPLWSMHAARGEEESGKIGLDARLLHPGWGRASVLSYATARIGRRPPLAPTDDGSFRNAGRQFAACTQGSHEGGKNEEKHEESMHLRGTVDGLQQVN
ncbi:uncharacterized protein PG998_002680 [Apiospora kogelbergensis]|uniref:uncharacterized protein n=1 Tax=Apiospora kogelbergensis TaxID=1337665 RepID=UPI0031306B1E